MDVELYRSTITIDQNRIKQLTCMYEFLSHLKSLLSCQNHFQKWGHHAKPALPFTSDGEPLSWRAMMYITINVTIQKIGSIS